MKPEELPEDIDGREENPYQRDTSNFPFDVPQGKFCALLGAFWREREYWRHWKRVRKDTGRWPFWSAVFHLVLVVGIGCNGILFFWARDTQDWSTARSWIVGGVFAGLWLVFIGLGREAIRAYEAKFYTEREQGRRHLATRR